MIILDVRSGERNDSSTGLALRGVLGHSEEQVGGFIRRGYDLYDIGVKGDYCLISSGDGELGIESGTCSFTRVGTTNKWLTGIRGFVSEVRNKAGVILPHYFGGTVVESEVDISGDSERGTYSLLLGGVSFWWSRNDAVRTRFEYVNRGWGLLRGGSGLFLGVVGGEEDLVVKGLSGELRIGGGDVSSPSVTVYEIGEVDVFPLVLEGEEEEELSKEGVEGVVLNPSGKVLFKEGTEHTGKSVLQISGSLGLGFNDGVVVSGSYLSPQPRSNEYPLLRVSGYGYSDVVFVATESDLVGGEYGKVKVSLDSGRILTWEYSLGNFVEVIYDGLVLCDAPVGLVSSGVDLGNSVGVVDGVGVIDIPDGSGLEPLGVATSFRPTGVGLKWDYRYERMYVVISNQYVLPVEVVESLPKKLSTRKGYIVRGERKVILSGWSKLVLSGGHKLYGGHIGFSRGTLSHVSGLGLAGKSGSFRVDGLVVNFSGEVLSGLGSGLVSVVRGHLVVVAGSVLDYPNSVSEHESLKSIGLVPDVSLETGLEIILTRSTIKGYYDYDEEGVGSISGSSAFQILQFEPRNDFVGFSEGSFFKVGDKVLGVNDIETSFGGFPNGFHWVKNRSISSKVNQETSRLSLGAGVRVGTTSISIKQEQIDGSVNTQYLEEGVDYDLPSGGLEGQARLINRLGSEILRGQKMGAMIGLTLDLEVSLALVSVGDFFYDGLNYFKIEVISGTIITLSSVLGLQSGRWKIYKGYQEGVVLGETPDPTKVVGEILDDLPLLERKSVEVYKVYSTLAFDKTLPSSTLSIRKVESGIELTYPLTVLRDDLIESPYELSGVHYTSGSYRIKVEGVEYEADVMVGGQGFTVVSDKVVFQKDGVSSSTWIGGEVIYVRKPRVGLLDVAEMDLSLTLTSPFTPTDSFDDFLELLSDPNVEPSSGAISFEDPLEEGVGVEVSYTPTDDPSSRIIEAMGFTVIQEGATRKNANEFTYNSTNKEIELQITPTVLVGPEQIDPNLYSIDQNKILFSFSIGADVGVKVSYTTLKSNGGDATVRTSSGMVVPKYKIDKGKTSLSVQRDFTGTLDSGDLIKVGTQLFNVVSVSSSAITVNPSARFNIEADVISYLNVPTFNYNGVSSSYAFRVINGANVTSKPKSPDLFLQGDYRDFIKANSLLIIQATPYRVKVVGLEEKTGTTKVTVEGFTTGHDIVSSNNDLFVSFRPILIEGDTNISLNTGLVDSETFELVKYDHSIGRGRLLVQDTDYKLNSEVGAISLVNGHAVSPQVSYYLLHTSLSGVKPFTLLGGRVSKPVYSATFNQSSSPTEYDGLTLTAKCVVSSPDTFQVRIVEDSVYSSEIANDLQNNLNQGQGSGGKLVITSPISQGNAIGVYDLLANDVVARSRVNLYNGYVQPVDDITSTTTGKVVGDKDGSFKFNLLSSSGWIAPGLEDSITREIYPRYVSMEYLTPLNPSNPYPTSEDPIKIGDSPPSVNRLSLLLEQQRDLIENEMDDYVLVGQKENVTFDFGVGFPYIKYDYDPVYKAMWERHRFSRLYPTSTRMYSYRAPGTLNSSTNGTTIANVQNNALGQIENITSLSVVKRRPSRFRVYDFSTTGFPSIDASTSGKPTLILSALPLDEFPIDSVSGNPDTTQFLSEGGALADVVVGNVDRTFNGLRVSSKLKLSRNGGEFFPILNTAQTSTLIDLGLFPPLTKEEPRNAVVLAPLKGCLVVLDGTSFNLKVNGESLIDNPPKRGDTIIESFLRDLDDDTSSVTTFRVGSDIGLKSSTGELVDISLPSINDPDWPVKEIVGQSVPASGLALEGDVDFLYTETPPFNYPALQGQPVDDTGDESIPYMSRFNERDLLPQVPLPLNNLQTQTLNTISSVNEYVYPDEARGLASIGSGSITTSSDFSNLNGVCEQSVRQGDLILLKPDDSGLAGTSSTGVLEVASIDGATIYPPSFESPSEVIYDIDNLLVELNLDTTQGLRVIETWTQNPLLYSVSTTVMTFEGLPSNTIENIFNSASANTQIQIRTHSFSSPYSNEFTFTFTYDGANWSVVLTDETIPKNLPATNITSIVASGNEITIVQNPVADAFSAIGGETWGDYTDMESWLFNTTCDFWASSGLGVQPLFFTSDGVGVDHLDYRLSILSGVANVNTNRIEVDFVNTNLTSWFYSNVHASMSGTDTQQRFKITDSNLTVKREDAPATTHTISSNLNDLTLPFTDSKVEVVSDTKVRIKSLGSISRIDEPMSIFIGSEVDETDTILQGLASSGLVNDAGDEDKGKGILRDVSATHGSLAQVLIGDLLYIESGHNAGTHRVKGVVESDLSTEYTETLGSSSLLQVVFPKVVSVSDNGDGTGTVITDLANLSDYFPSTGEMFILLNNNYLNKPISVTANDYDEVYGFSQIHVEYDSILGNSFIFTEDLTGNDENPHYADGERNGGGGGGGANHPTGVTIADLIVAVDNGGQTIGGQTRFPFDTLSLGHGDIPLTIAHSIEVYFNVGGGYTGTSNSLNENQIERDSNSIIVAINLPTNNIYERVTDNPEGNEYHDTYITPNDTIKLTVNVSNGIYLDPAFPRLLRDYNGTTPVEFGDGTSQVRSPIQSALSNLPAWDWYEEVSFTVRRIRRFTDVFSKLIYAFEGFRYLYEQRVGRVNSVVYANGVVTLTPLKVGVEGSVDANGTDTQVGEFTNVVSVGDQVQCVNSSNQETLYLRVLEVGSTLKCSSIRGTVSDVSYDDVFKVITRVPLIPELQAFDQFIEHGFTEIHSSSAVSGISVITENGLTDTNVNFQTLGVTEGDFLVIDPQGLLAGTVSEYGSPPQGDNGDGTVGTPNNLDDNRGSYKVTSVNGSTLTVEFYAGSKGTTRTSYKLLPSVNGDDSQPLRVTSEIDGGTYDTNNNSIAPFSYRIIRRNTALEEELAGSILFFRERTLSWVEVIRAFNQLPTQPYTWSQYESESLIDDVGLTDRSHPSNDILIQNILGNEGTKPFDNNTTCLSVYDRRMLIGDPKMSSEGYGTPEDSISEVLENDISSMNARGNRYAWISIRTDQVNGTLAKLSRVDLNNPDDTTLEDIK